MGKDIEETPEHKATVEFLERQFKKSPQVYRPGGFPAVKAELDLGNTIPDVYIMLNDRQEVGVEYQRSWMKDGELEEKLKRNTGKNIATLYILGLDFYLPKFEQGNIRIRGMDDSEFKIWNMWKELYYIFAPKNAPESRIINVVTSIHMHPDDTPDFFERYGKDWKKEWASVAIDWKRLNSYGLKVEREKSKGYLIAKFCDLINVPVWLG